MDIVVIDSSIDDFDSDLFVSDMMDGPPGPFQTEWPGSVLAYDRFIHGHRAFPAANVSEMVSGVLRRLGSQSIGRLIIWGHGIPGAQGMGAGDCRFNRRGASLGMLIAVIHGRLTERGDLMRLRGRFSPTAVVELHGCNVAQHHSGRLLLRTLSDLWDVRVRAGVNVQQSHADDAFDGPVIEAFPRFGHGSRVHLLHS